MKRFGYLEPIDDGAAESLYDEVSIKSALREVQKFGNIPQTGQLDNDTLRLMGSRRCGVPDVLREDDWPKAGGRKKRRKRFVIGSKGWTKRRLTYYLGNWTPKLSRDDVNRELKDAMDQWGRYGHLVFSESRDPANADIVVGFYRGSHGDMYPFDGQGRVLAHAYFPSQWGNYGGDIHFDDDEEWVIRPAPLDPGVDFAAVALHELGHSLGLSHSPEPDSVMNPYYKNSYQGLGNDDILAMYNLYIQQDLGSDEVTTPYTTRRPYTPTTSTPTTSRVPPRRTTQRTTTPTPTTSYTTSPRETTTHTRRSTPSTEASIKTSTIPTTDRPSKYNESVTSENPQTPCYNISYVGDDESVESHKGHDSKHKVPIVDPGCRGSFDAASFLRGELFMVRNQTLWRLSSPGNVLEGYPVKLRRFFHKLPPEVTHFDALYERRRDSSIVIFCDNYFWVFDGYDFIEGSPRPISYYGLPDSISKVDAVMVWARNSKTYIFSGEYYWRWDDETKKADPGYPKLISESWKVPPYLDTALTDADGITYFFKDDNYWAMDNIKVKPLPGYPKSASDFWIGC